MKIFNHHIYEYKKGIRSLVLHTLPFCFKDRAEAKLKKNDIPYFIHEVSDNRVNIFFGKEECVAVVKGFGYKKLNCFTAEEDFILGIMLGYDRLAQCERYLKNKSLMSLKSAV